jgi:hypothetical protein
MSQALAWHLRLNDMRPAVLSGTAQGERRTRYSV